MRCLPSIVRKKKVESGVKERSVKKDDRIYRKRHEDNRSGDVKQIQPPQLFGKHSLLRFWNKARHVARGVEGWLTEEGIQTFGSNGGRKENRIGTERMTLALW